MSISDWDITQGGDTTVAHSAFQHSLVPTQQLTHDVWARSLDSVGGVGHGRYQFLYGTSAPDYAEFDLTKDVSVRGLFSLGLRGADHSIALGVRCDAIVPSGTTNDQNIATNGYQLTLTEDGVNWNVKISRVTAGVAVDLDNVNIGAGSSGDYKWFHMRLDFLLQPNGDATIQAFLSDISTYPINPANPPEWDAVWVKILEVNEVAAVVPNFARVGWGGQVDPGAGALYESYVDWVEAWHS